MFAGYEPHSALPNSHANGVLRAQPHRTAGAEDSEGASNLGGTSFLPPQTAHLP